MFLDFRNLFKKHFKDNKFVRKYTIENKFYLKNKKFFKKSYLKKKKKAVVAKVKFVFNKIKYRNWWIYNGKLLFRFFKLEFFKKSSYAKFIFVMKSFFISVLLIFLLIIMVLKEADMSDYIDFDIPEISANENFVFNVQGLEISGFDNNDKFIVVRSEDGEEKIQGSKMYFKGMEARISSRLSSEWTYFKGENTIYDKVKKEVLLPENFSVRNDKGWYLSGKNGILDVDEMIAYSDEFVVMESDMGRLEAEGFYVDPEKIYKFKGRVNFIFSENSLPKD